MHPFWYGPANEILLLKPHGSIDWFQRSQIPRQVSERAIRKLDEDLVVYPEFTLAKHRQMKHCTPMIVAPVFRKDFTQPFLKHTWRRVYSAISRATDLYFIGYSLPKEDQFARFVFNRALRNNRLRISREQKPRLTVRVVNPDEMVQPTFTRLIGQKFAATFHFYHTTFDQFGRSVEEGTITLK